MSGAGEMLVRVTIFGVIAATDVTAGSAQSQVHPIVPHGQAFDAPVSRGTHRLNGVEMSTLLGSTHAP
jgi:hypothetical protein